MQKMPFGRSEDAVPTKFALLVFVWVRGAEWPWPNKKTKLGLWEKPYLHIAFVHSRL